MHDLVVVEKKVEGILSEIEGEAFFGIPFGNSDFQTRAFVIAAQQTPGRAYRAIGLQMKSAIDAVRHALYEREKQTIDRDELEYKLGLDSTSEFDKRRHRLEIARMDSGHAWQDKLLNDKLHELEILYAEFKRFPVYTREKFEAEEAGHYDKRLRRQIERGGPVESLDNMHADLPALETMLADAKLLTG